MEITSKDMRFSHLISTFKALLIVLVLFNAAYCFSNQTRVCLTYNPAKNETQKTAINKGIKPEGRVVNGTLEDIKDYPFTAKVTSGAGFQCGGTIISEYYVISAAHCIRWALFNYYILAGSTNIATGEAYGIKEATIHPEYKPISKVDDADVVILRTTKKITFSVSVQPAKLPKAGEEIATGAEATALGWGRLEKDGFHSRLLMGIKLHIRSDKDCKTAYQGFITKYMMCAGYKEIPNGVCGGDSGGPLVINGTLVGVVSWGVESCAELNCPDVFVKVTAILDWIHNVTGIEI